MVVRQGYQEQHAALLVCGVPLFWNHFGKGRDARGPLQLGWLWTFLWHFQGYLPSHSAVALNLVIVSVVGARAPLAYIWFPWQHPLTSVAMLGMLLAGQKLSLNKIKRGIYKSAWEHTLRIFYIHRGSKKNDKLNIKTQLTLASRESHRQLNTLFPFPTFPLPSSLSSVNLQTWC